MNTETAQTMLKGIAKDLTDKVLSIESGPLTTKDHYGAYLAFLTNFEESSERAIMALAMVEAGKIVGHDNQAGIRSALKIMGH